MEDMARFGRRVKNVDVQFTQSHEEIHYFAYRMCLLFLKVMASLIYKITTR